MLTLIRNIFFIVSIALLFISCNDNPVQTYEPTSIFTKDGLVDSVIVTQCVASQRSFFTDTLEISSYSKIQIMLDGLTNSDGSFIKVYVYTDTTGIPFELYSAVDRMNVSMIHNFEINKPNNRTKFEIRMYINPPICGTGDFKFTRVRDLKIYGIR